MSARKTDTVANTVEKEVSAETFKQTATAKNELTDDANFCMYLGPTIPE